MASRPAGTEDRLLDCALTLFAEKGYTATGTQEIIDAAGVSKPVLYHHFGSKAGLFERLARSIHAAACADWDDIIATECGCSRRFRSMIRRAFAGCAADPRVPRLMFQTTYGPPIPELARLLEQLANDRFRRVCAVILDGQRAGELRAGSTEAVALAWCCLMDQHLNLLSRQPDPARHLTPALADSVVDLFFHGMAICG